MEKRDTAWIPSPQPPIDGGRIEIKYAVPEKLAAEVLRWSSVFLSGDGRLRIAQRVTSLYLDTPTLMFFRWHLQGRRDRFKLRVRAYGDRSDGRLYAEVKRKTGHIVRKQRAEISTAELGASIGAPGVFAELHLEETRSEALRSFLTKRAAFHAEPKMLISCERDALRETTAGGEVAVTVDRRIRYQQTCRLDLMADSRAWQSVLLPQVVGSEAAIIELKYSLRPPQWMKTLIVKLAPHHLNFSKYKAAMQQNAEWSACHVQSSESGIEYGRDGLRAVVRAFPDDRARLCAY